MLNAPTPFPHVGSWCLWTNDDAPIGQQETLLAKILGPVDGEHLVLVSLPERTGASGTCRVPFAQLIDGTPLTGPEKRELATLESRLAAVKHPRRSACFPRQNDLRKRAIWAPFLAMRRRQLDERTRRAA